MFKNILIVGCGLIGSSILRASIDNKTSKKFFDLQNLHVYDMLNYSHIFHGALFFIHSSLR